MWKYYLRSAWRNLKKGKLYSIINIAGLSIGLATGIMLLIWVQNESSFDAFFQNADRIYRVNTHFMGQENAGQEVVYPMTPPKVFDVTSSIPAVAAASRIIDNGQARFTRARLSRDFKLSSLFVDNSFLSVFSFKLLAGNRNGLWQNPYSIVLTASAAKKIYGNTAPLGQVLNYDGHPMTITGILADFPENSTIRADVLLPISYYAAGYAARHSGKNLDEDRQNFSMSTFLLLRNKTDANKVAAAVVKNWTDIGDKRFEFRLQHLTDIHLIQPNGNNSAYRLVQVFMVIMLMLFLIACINYVNMSTARSLVRAKEVGIKKIVGAKRRQLFFQFMGETVMVFGISMVIAIGLIFALMPLYNFISGKAFSCALNDWQLWKTLGVVLIATLLVASIYPAILLSSFKPIESLKGKISRNIGANTFRKGLVVFQFFMAAVLLFVTLIMGRQLDYIRNINIGYDRAYVFTVTFPKTAIPHLEAIKADLLHYTSIENIGLSSAEELTNLNVSSTSLKKQGQDPNSSFLSYPVAIDASFIPAMKMALAHGRNFTGSPADSLAVILNQTAVRQMGLKAPYLGQEVGFSGKKYKVIGVVKDFNFQDLRSAVSPLVFYVQPKSWNTLYVRTSARQMKSAIAAVADAYTPYKTSDAPFSYHFLDKQFENLYKSDMRVGALFTTFASIAIFISCLGLFGLATYSTETRIKEMGIRKVLGASARSLVRLICKEFVVLVLLAILIATPVSYLLAGRWLRNFAYQSTIGADVFIEVFCTLMLITFMTISLKVYKAAKSNLLRHLKSE
ncbi:ABC transporter permease [Arachidicoccus terrestris]|uniref:ABC transporter permease n=1 Tax=Arachidicoccus terrestris TaxID=2875539 RepID=UPI001CC50EC9|nr:ABC transporter permease [Arachidicoccus terrestris]UAY56468.1 ABC transporter permease [Arachidicoccus terrestris]